MGETRDRLSASDALLWRIEADPVLRSPILVVGLLDRPPDWGRVLASAAGAVERIPRLRRRIVGGGPLGRAWWEDDPAFCLEHHVRRIRAATPGGVQAALDVAEPDACAAFDPARPPWTFVIVEGLEQDTAAFVLRFHHAISDGVGAIGLAEHLFDRSRRRRAAGRPDAVDAGVGPAPATPATALGALGGALSAATGLARAAGDPVRTARRGLRFTRSVTRMLAGAPAPLSPALVGRGIERRLDVFELPVADLRAAAHTAGGTVNDALLAAVGGGLRRYHESVGSPVAAVRLTVPISIRDGDDDPGGNHFAPARFVLPIDDPDPVARASIAGAIVRRWRAEPALGATAVLAEALDLLPTSAVVALFAGMLRGVDADVVDVPGLRHGAYLAGAKVDRLWAFAPPTGAALSVTLLSHGATACVGVASDTAAVAEPALLAACLRDGFDEVLAVGATPRPAPVPAELVGVPA